MKLFYTDRSKNDLVTAFNWYENQRKGLGNRFLDCVEAAIQDIEDYPKVGQIIYSCFHAYPVRRFPFSIFYSIEKKCIVIHAIFDNRQDPAKWP